MFSTSKYHSSSFHTHSQGYSKGKHPKTESQFWEELDRITEEMVSCNVTFNAVQQEAKVTAEFVQELADVANTVRDHIDQLITRQNCIVNSINELRSSAKQNFQHSDTKLQCEPIKSRTQAQQKSTENHPPGLLNILKNNDSKKDRWIEEPNERRVTKAKKELDLSTRSDLECEKTALPKKEITKSAVANERSNTNDKKPKLTVMASCSKQAHLQKATPAELPIAQKSQSVKKRDLTSARKSSSELEVGEGNKKLVVQEEQRKTTNEKKAKLTWLLEESDVENAKTDLESKTERDLNKAKNSTKQNAHQQLKKSSKSFQKKCDEPIADEEENAQNLMEIAQKPASIDGKANFEQSVSSQLAPESHSRRNSTSSQKRCDEPITHEKEDADARKIVEIAPKSVFFDEKDNSERIASSELAPKNNSSTSHGSTSSRKKCDKPIKNEDPDARNVLEIAPKLAPIDGKAISKQVASSELAAESHFKCKPTSSNNKSDKLITNGKKDPDARNVMEIAAKPVPIDGKAISKQVFSSEPASKNNAPARPGSTSSRKKCDKPIKNEDPDARNVLEIAPKSASIDRKANSVQVASSELAAESHSKCKPTSSKNKSDRLITNGKKDPDAQNIVEFAPKLASCDNSSPTNSKNTPKPSKIVKKMTPAQLKKKLQKQQEKEIQNLLKAEQLNAENRKLAEEAERHRKLVYAVTNTIQWYKCAGDRKIVGNFNMTNAKKFIEDRIQHFKRTNNLEMVHFYTILQDNFCAQVVSVLLQPYLLRKSATQCYHTEKAILEDMKCNADMRAGWNSAQNAKRCINALIPFYVSVQHGIRYGNAPIPKILEANRTFMELHALWKTADRTHFTLEESTECFMDFNWYHEEKGRSEDIYPSVLYLELSKRKDQVVIDDGCLLADLMAQGKPGTEIDVFYYSIMRTVRELQLDGDKS